MANRIERQRPQLAFDACLDQYRIDGGGQQVRPGAVGQWTSQVIEDELYGHGGWQRSATQRLPITQLQPSRPVGEGAAVTAHRVGRGAGCDKRRCGFLRVKRQELVGLMGFRRPRPIDL